MTNLPQIDFPDIDDIALNQVIFEGIAPPDIDANLVFQPNSLVGLFVSTNNPVDGPEWGLTQGGTLTAEGFISVFQKTSPENNGIMRLKNLDGNAWSSLRTNGLTGWSVRVISGNYYGFVFQNNPEAGICQRLEFIVDFVGVNPRILLGPTGVDDTYLLYKCVEDSSITGATANENEVFVKIQGGNISSQTFESFVCISPGTSTTDPATFTGPFEIQGTFFTSTSPLTGGAQCDYPYIWSWGPKWQQWKFDCGVTAWLTDGASITEGGNGPQGSQGVQGLQGEDVEGGVGATGPQGFQGFQGIIGRQGFQGFQGFRGLTGNQGVQGFQGFQGRMGRQGFQGLIGLNSPSGSDTQIQYKSGSSFAADSRSTVSIDNSMDLNSGYSGNFLNYSESVRVDSSTYSNGGTVNLSFGSYNTYRATNISLRDDTTTLVFEGFNSGKTGQTLTLILGHDGPNGSKIAFKGSDNIHWQDGPFGNDDIGGQTSFLYPSETKKYDIFYFINDGQRTYGNRSNSYSNT
jgi:hypothetical protein